MGRTVLFRRRGARRYAVATNLLHRLANKFQVLVLTRPVAARAVERLIDRLLRTR